MQVTDPPFVQERGPRPVDCVVPPAVGWSSDDVLKWMRLRIAAAGGDTDSVPDEPFRFLRRREVEVKVGLGRSSIYRQIRIGKFPAPVTLGATLRAD